MNQLNWIFGPSIDSLWLDSKDYPDFQNDDLFLGYLVHLEHPRCVMLVSRSDFKHKYYVPLDRTTGYFHHDKVKDINIILVQWLDKDIQVTAEEATRLVSEAAVHFEIHTERLIENAITTKLMKPKKSPRKALSPSPNKPKAN